MFYKKFPCFWGCFFGRKIIPKISIETLQSQLSKLKDELDKKRKTKQGVETLSNLCRRCNDLTNSFIILEDKELMELDIETRKDIVNDINSIINFLLISQRRKLGNQDLRKLEEVKNKLKNKNIFLLKGKISALNDSALFLKR